ncbi:hypothetical protein AX15_001470 [Amanita polypyramis BW_CC]|nr:hypothetical protein AX15_001470 [Amanita polypyramis BW_CC]
MSDLLNSLNNTVAGFYILAKRKGLDPGRACVFNGIVGQITVQATDCAILAIAISTVYAITRRGPISTVLHTGWQRNRLILVCCAIWTVPFFTGFLALGMGWYEPATGNWCWIKAKPSYLRYVLTHGWRFLFIAIEICLYVYLNYYLRRHYRTLAAAIQTGNSPMSPTLSEPHPHSSLQFSAGGTSSAVDIADTEKANSIEQTNNGVSTVLALPCLAKLNRGTSYVSTQQQRSHPTSWSLSITGLRGTNYVSGSFSADAQYQAIQRALLLNAYPLAYIILWIPGMVNRLIEATGHTSTVMQFLQALTQLVGLANALTYGWNERVAKQLRERFSKRR